MLVGKKKSQPYSPESVHDFMHNKLMVTDSTCVTESFNLSNKAERNAENALSIHLADLVKAFRANIEKLIIMYED